MFLYCFLERIHEIWWRKSWCYQSWVIFCIFTTAYHFKISMKRCSSGCKRGNLLSWQSERWGLNKMNKILKTFSSAYSWMKTFEIWIKFYWNMSLGVLLAWSLHWFRWWLSVIRQQAISWFNFDKDIRCHMASLHNNELTRGVINKIADSLLISSFSNERKLFCSVSNFTEIVSPLGTIDNNSLFVQQGYGFMLNSHYLNSLRLSDTYMCQ